ncbi:MAG: flagellar basal body rod protein FlgB [Planctomycetaceae bacterium]
MTPITPQSELLTRLLDATATRHAVVSQNIANVNTPHYKRLDVDFEATLASTLRSGANPTSAAGEPVIHEERGLPTRRDGNNVDIDRELGELGKNSLLHQTYTELLSTDFDAMRRAIRLR